MTNKDTMDLFGLHGRSGILGGVLISCPGAWRTPADEPAIRRNREANRRENGMTKIELENRVPLYKSGDMKLGEIVTETVKDVREQDFRSDPEDEPNKKWVLIFESGKGLALSYSNVVFLLEHGVKEYESLIGMKVVFGKEARSITAGDGKKHDVVGLFLKELH